MRKNIYSSDEVDDALKALKNKYNKSESKIIRSLVLGKSCIKAIKKSDGSTNFFLEDSEKIWETLQEYETDNVETNKQINLLIPKIAKMKSENDFLKSLLKKR